MNAIPFDMVTWFQIPAENAERAWRFYGRCFGWSQQASYADQKHLGAINGEIAEREDTLTAPRLVIRVTDIAATVAKIEEAGGKVVATPVTIEEIGMVFASFRDTEGNILNIVADA